MCVLGTGRDSPLLFALQPPEQPPYPHHQGGPPHCPPWNNSHEGMWGEQRGDPGWNGQRDAPWNSQPDPNWNSQFEGPWNSQHEQPPWGGGQREPPFRMQRPPHFRGPFPPHQQHPQFNQPPHPHNFNRFPPRFMQDDFPPRHPFERPPYPHRFDYPQGDFQAGEYVSVRSPLVGGVLPEASGHILSCRKILRPAHSPACPVTWHALSQGGGREGSRVTEKPSPGLEAGGRWGHLLHVGWLLLCFLKKFCFYSASAWIFRSILDYKLSWETSRFIAYVKCSRAAVTGPWAGCLPQ